MEFEETLRELQGFIGKPIDVAVYAATEQDTPGPQIASITGTLEAAHTKASDEWVWLVLKERGSSVKIDQRIFKNAYWSQDHDAPTGELNIVQGGTVMVLRVPFGTTWGEPTET
jgi:hypothetical protein